MDVQDQSSEEMYLVVVKDEGQIWRDDNRVPAEWRAVGKRGPKSECMQYIEDVWTDMRPLSLRKRMAEAAVRDAHGLRNGGRVAPTTKHQTLMNGD